MGRPHRDFDDGTYHVAARASDDRRLFSTADDRRVFLARLSATFRKLDLELLTYVLMGTHYHALVRTPDARLSRALQGLHGGYALHHNRVHGRSAHLFRAHCVARRIEDDDDFLTTLRYLALNPVAAGLASDAFAWAWSSAAAHAGIEPAPVPLAERRLRDAFGGAPDWRARYRTFVAV